MNFYGFSLISVVLLCSVAIGHSTHEAVTVTPGKNRPAQFEIDRNLLNSIYQESIAEAKATSRVNLFKVFVSPQVSFVTSTELKLNNNYFDVSHSLEGVPTAVLNLRHETLSWKGLDLFLTLKAGLTYREGTAVIKIKSGRELNNIVKLFWLPLSAGTHVEYGISNLQWLKPYFDLSAGVQWFSQSGKIDGLDQGFWIPFYSVGGGLSLFNQSADQWFQGVNVGASILNSFGSDQTARVWSLDVGMSLML